METKKNHKGWRPSKYEKHVIGKCTRKLSHLIPTCIYMYVHFQPRFHSASRWDKRIYRFSSLCLNLVVSLEDVVFAKRTCCIHLKPFHDTCWMKVMIARKRMELSGILICTKAYTAFLRKKKWKLSWTINQNYQCKHENHNCTDLSSFIC